MAEDEKPQEQQASGPETEPKGAEQGKPDAAKAAEKYRQQRDEARKQKEELERRIEQMTGSNAEQIEKLQAELKSERERREADAKRAEYERVNSNRLTKAGCVDVEVALSLLDENGDVDKLKESKPYLFAEKKGTTGFPPAGAPNDKEARKKAARKAAGLI